MAYNKHTWYYGETVSATKLNNIENGIANNDSAIRAIPAELDEIQAELDEKANIDGAYESMTVGNAEQLISTQYVEDNAPYIFRTSGGSADIGNREEDTIVGGSIAWNQIADNSDAPTSRNGVTITGAEDGFTMDGTATSATDASGWFKLTGANADLLARSNHKMIVSFKLLSGTVTASDSATNPVYFSLGANTGYVFNGVPRIVVPPFVADSKSILHINNGTVLSNARYCIQVFDLTQMFGTSVADAVYAMEQANTGTGVSWFKSMFPLDYYAYNTGTLEHVHGLTSHDMVGFNAYNPETGKAKVIRNNVYQITGTYTALSMDGNTITPDASGYFTPSANGEVTVTGGNTTNTCIHLKWSGTRDGEYEPYEKRSYALDSTLTLRGIPKWGTDSMYYDGDIYNADGSVERRYGIVDLGTLNWTVSASNSNTFSCILPNGKKGANNDTDNSICSKYTRWSSTLINGNTSSTWDDKTYAHTISTTYSRYYFKDTSYTDANTFKTAMSGVMLVYELAEPTTETADPYTTPQIVEDWGTEEYVTTGIPVGHETKYQSNLRDKLQHLPDLAEDDGAYLIQQTGTQMTLVNFRIPKAENLADGTYVLKATVSGGTPTYEWVAEGE